MVSESQLKLILLLSLPMYMERKREREGKRERRTVRWLLGNLVIIHWERRLYQSGALIPLGPSKITMITAGLKGDQGTKNEMSRSKYIGYGEDRNQGSGSIFLTAI